MTRYAFTLPYDRAKALAAIQSAPTGSRVEIKGARRSNDQNALMWSLLTQISLAKEHYGQRYTPDQWKCIFMSALGKEMQFAPALDGKGFLAIGHRSSDLSKAEMADLITFILAWGAENGFEFREAA